MTARDLDWICDAMRRFEGRLLLYARRVTGDLESARDVVQDTFLKLCRQRRADVDARLAEWLYTVCRNGALDRLKRERTMLQNHAPTGDVANAATEAGPAAIAERREEGTRLLCLMAGLPDKQQEVLRLKFQSGLSYKEIAGVTGESMGNVGYLIHVGLKRLRELASESSRREEMTS